jgi:TPR repeat protein
MLCVEKRVNLGEGTMEQSIEFILPGVAVFLYFKLLLNIIGNSDYNWNVDTGQFTFVFNEAPLVEGLAQMVILGGRAGADVRYDALVYDSRSGTFSIEGLRVASEQGAFELGAARFSSIDSDAPIVDLRVAFDGLVVDPNNFPLPPEIGTQAALLGVETLVADGALEVSYDIQNSDAAAILTLDIDQLGRLAIAVDLTGLYVDQSGPDPIPNGALSGASVSFENQGAMAVVLRTMGMAEVDEATAAQMGQIAGQQALAMLSGADLGQQNTPSPAAQAFATNIEDAIARFLIDGDSIAVSIAPEQPVPLTDLQRLVQRLDAAASDIGARTAMLALLNPRIQAVPVALSPVIADLGDGPLIARAEALITGLGAPRNFAKAIKILAPAATAGDAEASLLLSEAYETRGEPGDLAKAYAAALKAEKGGADGARAAVAAIAAILPLKAMLAVEKAAFDKNALDELQSAAGTGDASAMRRLAQAYERGEGVARNIAEAYRWSILAAAAGDQAGLRLRDRVATRFVHAHDDEQALWARTRKAIEAAALADWNAGLGAAVVEASTR